PHREERTNARYTLLFERLRLEHRQAVERTKHLDIGSQDPARAKWTFDLPPVAALINTDHLITRLEVERRDHARLPQGISMDVDAVGDNRRQNRNPGVFREVISRAINGYGITAHKANRTSVRHGNQIPEWPPVNADDIDLK